MLASLLPGARDLRTPLTVGVVLAVAAWIAFGQHLPARDRARGFAAFTYETADLLGRATMLALVSFACYIVGSVVSQMLLGPLSRPWRRRGASGYRATEQILDIVSDALEVLSESALAMAVFDAGTAAQAGRSAAHQRYRPELESLMASIVNKDGDWEDVARRHLAGLYADLVASEIPTLSVRLRVQNKELYDDYDRHQAEGELRLLLALPIVALVVALASSTSPWVLLGAAVSPLLYVQGHARLARAREVIYQAVIHEVVVSPTLQRLARRTRGVSGTPSTPQPSLP